MALADKLLADEGRLSVHDIISSAREIRRGNLAADDAAKSLGLDADEQKDLEVLAASFAETADTDLAWDCIYHAQRGVPGYASPKELAAKLALVGKKV